MGDYILEQRDPNSGDILETHEFNDIVEAVNEIVTENGYAIRNGDRHIFMIIFAKPGVVVPKLSEELISQLEDYLYNTENNGCISFDSDGQEKKIVIVNESYFRDNYTDVIVETIVESDSTVILKALLKDKTNDEALTAFLSNKNNMKNMDNAVFIFPQFESNVLILKSVVDTVKILADKLDKQIVVYICENKDQSRRQQAQYEELSTKNNYLEKENKDILDKDIIRTIIKKHPDEVVKILSELISNKLIAKKQNDENLNEELYSFFERRD